MRVVIISVFFRSYWRPWVITFQRIGEARQNLVCWNLKLRNCDRIHSLAVRNGGRLSVVAIRELFRFVFYRSVSPVAAPVSHHPRTDC